MAYYRNRRFVYILGLYLFSIKSVKRIMVSSKINRMLYRLTHKFGSSKQYRSCTKRLNKYLFIFVIRLCIVYWTNDATYVSIMSTKLVQWIWIVQLTQLLYVSHYYLNYYSVFPLGVLFIFFGFGNFFPIDLITFRLAANAKHMCSQLPDRFFITKLQINIKVCVSHMTFIFIRIYIY